MFSERIFEKMYNGSRATPALERGVTQADESRRRGMAMEAISGVDIAIWDVKAQARGIPLYQALGAVRKSVRGYASGEEGGKTNAKRIALSRALAVRSYLMDKGIKPNRVDVRAYGVESDRAPLDRVDLIFAP